MKDKQELTTFQQELIDAALKLSDASYKAGQLCESDPNLGDQLQNRTEAALRALVARAVDIHDSSEKPIIKTTNIKLQQLMGSQYD